MMRRLALPRSARGWPQLALLVLAACQLDTSPTPGSLDAAVRGSDADSGFDAAAHDAGVRDDHDTGTRDSGGEMGAGRRADDDGDDDQPKGGRGAAGRGGAGGAGGRKGTRGGAGGSGGARAAAGAGGASAGVGGSSEPVGGQAGGAGEASGAGGAAGTTAAGAGAGGDAAAGASGMPSQPPAAGAAGSAAGTGTGGNAAAGTGGNAAAGSGGELAAGTGGMAAPAASDAELIGQLIGSLSPYAANQAVGALIALLAGSPTLTPSAMTQVLTLLAQVGGCAADAAVCQPACNVVQQRCLVCSPDPNCHASMERVCGAGTSMCH